MGIKFAANFVVELLFSCFLPLFLLSYVGVVAVAPFVVVVGCG